MGPVEAPSCGEQVVQGQAWREKTRESALQDLRTEVGQRKQRVNPAFAHTVNPRQLRELLPGAEEFFVPAVTEADRVDDVPCISRDLGQNTGGL